jgi:hypothetical protein
MGKAKDTCDEINAITGKLIENGICDNQKFARLKQITATHTEVSFDTSASFSKVLRNIPYAEMYEEIKRSQDYNIAMADGALIQLQYIFEGEELIKHRLAFLPSPDLTVYQNDPEIYESDIIFAEIVAKNIVTTPIRFDFDKDSFVSDVHPMAHCTIGQYKNCRIPVSSAVSPYRFFEFILSSFYNTAYRDFGALLGTPAMLHPSTITPSEQQKIHINLMVQA